MANDKWVDEKDLRAARLCNPDNRCKSSEKTEKQLQHEIKYAADKELWIKQITCLTIKDWPILNFSHIEQAKNLDLWRVDDEIFHKIIISLQKNNNLELPKVKKIDLSWTVTSDETLHFISEKCCDLRSLDLTYTGYQFTISGILKILKQCHKLGYLNISSCSDGLREQIKDVKDDYPKLTIIDNTPLGGF